MHAGKLTIRLPPVYLPPLYYRPARQNIADQLKAFSGKPSLGPEIWLDFGDALAAFIYTQKPDLTSYRPRKESRRFDTHDACEKTDVRVTRGVLRGPHQPRSGNQSRA